MSFASWDTAVASAPSSKSVAGYSILPIGAIELSASPRNPLGYYVCNGDIISKDTNPDLWLSIGNTYGLGLGLDPTDFALPNLLHNMPLGLPLVAYTNIGDNGIQITATRLYDGSATVSLNIANIPPHAHGYDVGGATSTAGGGFRSGDANVDNGNKTKSDIYNDAGTLITASNAAPTSFSVQNPYAGVQYLIRSTYAIPETSVVGRVNIDTTNNQFYVSWGGNNLTKATLHPGAYTFLQMLNEFSRAIIEQTSSTYFLNAYTIDTFGNYAFRILTPDNSTLAISFEYGAGAGGVTIGVLDKCADTLGLITRTTYTFDSSSAGYASLSSTKALKCNWNGSVADGTLIASDFQYITSWSPPGTNIIDLATGSVDSNGAINFGTINFLVPGTTILFRFSNVANAIDNPSQVINDMLLSRNDNYDFTGTMTTLSTSGVSAGAGTYAVSSISPEIVDDSVNFSITFPTSISYIDSLSLNW